MGSEQGEAIEKPVHRVCLKGFWLGKGEVMRDRWKRVMGGEAPGYPAAGISWKDAQTILSKLNEKDEGTVRLPSEEEWEYACRSGGRLETYCGGEAVDGLAWPGMGSGLMTPDPVAG